MKSNSFTVFLKRKDIVISAKRYFIDAMGAMAQGLFASLLIGTILGTIGSLSSLEVFSTMGEYAKKVSGPAMAVSIGFALKAPPLVLFSLLAVGESANAMGGAGGPLAVFCIAILASELGKAVSKETKVDIIVTPFVTIGTGVLLSMGIAKYIGIAANYIGSLVMLATELQPFLMGIIVAVIMGMVLTLPISSAAICHALGLVGLAGGAALAGCCAQMVGFAFMSFRENRWSGLISQGVGTSMLQMPNIIRKPIVWLPVIITSAVTGPLATCLFKLEMNGAAISSGMGTCGLVGQIGVVEGWLNTGKEIAAFDIVGLVMISLVIPAILTSFLGWCFRKIGWISDGDLKLD